MGEPAKVISFKKKKMEKRRDKYKRIISKNKYLYLIIGVPLIITAILMLDKMLMK